MRPDLEGSEKPVFQVTLDAVRNQYYLDATNEAHPIYTDPAVAAAAGLAGCPAPPTRLFGPANPEFGDGPAFLGADEQRTLMAGAGYRLIRPPLLGETLDVTARASKVEVKETKNGQVVLATLEFCYRDSTGSPVIIEELTFIERQEADAS